MKMKSLFLVLCLAVAQLSCGEKEVVAAQQASGSETGSETGSGQEDPGTTPGDVTPPADFEWPNDPDAFDYGLAPGERNIGTYDKEELAKYGVGTDASQRAVTGAAVTNGITYWGPGITFYGSRMTVEKAKNWTEAYPELVPADRCFSFKVNRPGSLKFYGAPDSGRIPTYHLVAVTKVGGKTSAKEVKTFTPTEVANGSLSENRQDNNIYSEAWSKYWITLDVTAEDLSVIEEAATLYFYHTSTANTCTVHYWPLIWISSVENPPVEGRAPKFRLAGDSTCRNYSESESPQAGWGQHFAEAMGYDAQVENYAIGGYSSKSFLTEGKWKNLIDATVPGDFVLIHFGHNDGSSKTERHTEVDGSSTEQYGNFQDNLKLMISDVLSRKATPILLTPTNFLLFDDGGKVVPSAQPYVAAVRDVAAETETPLIDVNDLMCKWLEKMGPEAAKPYYILDKRDPSAYDNAHLTHEGATLVARYVAWGMKTLGYWDTPGEDPALDPGPDPGDDPGENPGDDPGQDPPASFVWPNDPDAFDYGLAPGERKTGSYNKDELAVYDIVSGATTGQVKVPATTNHITYWGPGITFYGNRMTVEKVKNWSQEYPNVIPADRCMSFKINRPGSLKFYGAPGNAYIPTYHIALITKVKGVTTAREIKTYTPTEVANGSETANRTDKNIYSADWAKYWITLDVTAADLGEIDEAATLYFYHTYAPSSSCGNHYWPLIWISSEDNPQLPDWKPKFRLAGDSTCRTYNESEAPQAGWGQHFAEALGNDAQVVNYAIGGYSSKSFIVDGKWKGLIDATLPGDIVLIQWGHNDGAANKPERYTVVDGSSTEPYGNYQDNLKLMISDVRAKKAIPVLLTPTSNRSFSGSEAQRTIQTYSIPTKDVAVETETPLIDVNEMMFQWLQQLGPEGSKPYYVLDKRDPTANDNTHLTHDGATVVAQMVAQGIKDLGLWE